MRRRREREGGESKEGRLKRERNGEERRREGGVEGGNK